MNRWRLHTGVDDFNIVSSLKQYKEHASIEAICLSDLILRKASCSKKEKFLTILSLMLAVFPL